MTTSMRGGETRTAAATAGFADDRLQRLTDRLREDVAAGAIPGAVALIVRDGHTAYFEAFGYADRPTLRPMQRDSIFRIASMTKPLTVTAALMLQERGKLLLADPVSRYIPELHDMQVGIESVDAASGERRMTIEAARQPITVQDLMRHTAGFTYGQFGDSLVQREYVRANLMDPHQTNADMAGKLARIPLAYQPGTTFEYGMSTDVLGRVVEIVAETSLDRFFAEHITGPLDLKDTGFAIRPTEAHRLAEPHLGADAGSAPARIAYDPARAVKWFSGGGGLLSSAADYARYCRMLLNGGELEGVRLLSRKTVELMTRNHLPP
ncbi:MAG TPA: serine hydrolase domain-containing protein, partial [Steroidobacteraceae bacterium]